jgi:hypothetical protein
MNISNSTSAHQTIDYSATQVLNEVLKSLTNLVGPLHVDRSWKEKLENSDLKTNIIFRELVNQTLKLALKDDSKLKNIGLKEGCIKYQGEQPTKWHVHFRMSDDQRDERYLITDVIGSKAWPVALEIRNTFQN